MQARVSAVSVADPDDEFAGGGVVLHIVVGPTNLFEPVVHVVDGDAHAAVGDGVQHALHRLARQVGGVALVGGQPDSGGEVVDRVEVLDRPLIGQQAGEADGAVHP